MERQAYDRAENLVTYTEVTTSNNGVKYSKVELKILEYNLWVYMLICAKSTFQHNSDDTHPTASLILMSVSYKILLDHSNEFRCYGCLDVVILNKVCNRKIFDAKFVV